MSETYSCAEFVEIMILERAIIERCTAIKLQYVVQEQ